MMDFVFASSLSLRAHVARSDDTRDEGVIAREIISKIGPRCIRPKRVLRARFAQDARAKFDRQKCVTHRVARDIERQPTTRSNEALDVFLILPIQRVRRFRFRRFTHGASERASERFIANQRCLEINESGRSTRRLVARAANCWRGAIRAFAHSNGFLTAVKRSFFARKDINLRLAVHESRRVTREIANRLLTPRQRTTVSHASTSTRRTTIRRRNARSGGTTTRSRIPQKPNFQPPLPSRVVFPADQHWARHLYLNDRDYSQQYGD